jgi:thiol-disulfide isomerase/thioredoxin
MSKNTEYLISAVVLIIVIVFIYYEYMNYKTLERYCNMDGECGDRTIIYWSASWCPACAIFKPTWDQVVADLSNTGINFVSKVDDPNIPAYVSTFPTIIMYSNGKINRYNGLRNYDQLKLWCQSISQTIYQN